MVKSRVLALCALTCGLSTLRTACEQPGTVQNLQLSSPINGNTVALLTVQDDSNKKGEFVGNEHIVLASFDFDSTKRKNSVADAKNLTIAADAIQKQGGRTVICVRSERGIDATLNMLATADNSLKSSIIKIFIEGKKPFNKQQIALLKVIADKQLVIQFTLIGTQPIDKELLTLIQKAGWAYTMTNDENDGTTTKAINSYVAQLFPAPAPQPAPAPAPSRRRCRGGCCSCR